MCVGGCVPHVMIIHIMWMSIRDRKFIGKIVIQCERIEYSRSLHLN